MVGTIRTPQGVYPEASRRSDEISYMNPYGWVGLPWILMNLYGIRIGHDVVLLGSTKRAETIKNLWKIDIVTLPGELTRFNMTPQH